MEWIAKTLLVLHIAAGFISLILFWIPVIVKKGGDVHRKVGISYVYCMWIVVGTAALLSMKNLYIGATNMAIFLGFITLITANPLWYGIAILKKNSSQNSNYRIKRFALDLTIVLSAIAMIIYGISSIGNNGTAILMFIFGGLGLTDIPNVISNLKGNHKEENRMRAHVVGMCTSGIAAYTAFFVFGANQYLEMVLSGYWMILPWVAPAVIGAILIRRSVQKYAKPVKVAN